MNEGGTPLGFLPGVIYPGSHCMFSYNKLDEAYVQSVGKYLAAGVASGQMCICAVVQPARSLIKQQMKKLGVSLTSGQLLIPVAESVYFPQGDFDVKHIGAYYRRNAAIADDKWNGMRVFGDLSPAVQNRAMRIKLLEYEALINSRPRSLIAMCGYQASLFPRSYLLQAKSVHPFIASLKSMRMNRSFVDSAKFLTALYRFRRVDKEYPAAHGEIERISSDIEDLAVRTRMTIPDISEVRQTVCSLFANLVDSVPADSTSSHVHMVYAPKPDKLAISLRYHKAMLQEAKVQLDWALARKVMDVIQIDEVGTDWIITMVKTY